MYHELMLQNRKMLNNLRGWLDKAEAYAKERGFDVDVLLQSRLYPDMFPLVRQIQAACDHAKFLASRLSGKQAPAHPDTEKTVGELRERLDKVISYLDQFTRDDLAGAEERRVELHFAPGKWIPGNEYAVELSLPNFYFHITMAYAILRHNGVNVGKLDFMGPIALRDLA